MNRGKLLQLNDNELKLCVHKRKIEYLKDINVDELISEIESFKRQVKSLITLDLKNIIQKEVENYIPFDFLKFMHAVGA